MNPTADIHVSPAQLADFAGRRHVRELAMFGSMARGDARPDSDVDLMIEFLPNDQWDLPDLVDMQADLETLFARPVDLVEKTAVKNPYRRATIDRDLTILNAAR